MRLRTTLIALGLTAASALSASVPAAADNVPLDQCGTRKIDYAEHTYRGKVNKNTQFGSTLAKKSTHDLSIKFYQTSSGIYQTISQMDKLGFTTDEYNIDTTRQQTVDFYFQTAGPTGVRQYTYRPVKQFARTKGKAVCTGDTSPKYLDIRGNHQDGGQTYVWTGKLTRVE
ncbi:hypothetical protein AB8O64_11295 [Streptomyces sp. QH1-20]|uniref:hypothetical protein n=1 Tax=Streptomyces sp. QH1-20 TaxID=3240934 RepID=UPI003515E158